jgi:hypothetical protein
MSRRRTGTGDRRTRVSRWMAGLAGVVTVAGTVWVLGPEIGPEIRSGIESGEVVGSFFVAAIVGGIVFALAKAALPSTTKPEFYLCAVTAALFSFALIAVWFGGPYVVAGTVTMVAWIVGQTTTGPSVAAQIGVFVASTASVFALFVAATYLASALTP